MTFNILQQTGDIATARHERLKRQVTDLYEWLGARTAMAMFGAPDPGPMPHQPIPYRGRDERGRRVLHVSQVRRCSPLALLSAAVLRGVVSPAVFARHVVPDLRHPSGRKIDMRVASIDRPVEVS